MRTAVMTKPINERPRREKLPVIDVEADQVESIKKTRLKTHGNAPFGTYPDGRLRHIPEEAITGEKLPFLAEFVEKAFNFALLRREPSKKELANHFNVSVSELNGWIAQYPDFRNALREGGVEADASIARTLYERAKGLEYEEEQAIKTKVGDGLETIEIIKVKKRLPPDVKAADIWLKNRDKDWQKDLPVAAQEDLTTKSSEEVAKKISFLLAKAEAGQANLTVNIDNRQQSVTMSESQNEGEN